MPSTIGSRPRKAVIVIAGDEVEMQMAQFIERAVVHDLRNPEWLQKLSNHLLNSLSEVQEIDLLF